MVYMGADAFKPLCRIACNLCESNLRFISDLIIGLASSRILVT